MHKNTTQQQSTRTLPESTCTVSSTIIQGSRLHALHLLTWQFLRHQTAQWWCAYNSRIATRHGPSSQIPSSCPSLRRSRQGSRSRLACASSHTPILIQNSNGGEDWTCDRSSQEAGMHHSQSGISQLSCSFPWQQCVEVSLGSTKKTGHICQTPR